MSLLLAEDFEAVVGTGANPVVLQDVIDREEAELAHQLGGPLSGERTQTFRPPLPYDGPLWLARFTDEVEVTDAGAAVTVRLVENGGAVERADGAWQGTVEVTYEPNDEARLVRALIELVRDIVVPDRDREAGTVRNLDRILQGDKRRAHMVRSLRPRPGHGTLVVRPSDRITAVST